MATPRPIRATRYCTMNDTSVKVVRPRITSRAVRTDPAEQRLGEDAAALAAAVAAGGQLVEAGDVDGRPGGQAALQRAGDGGAKVGRVGGEGVGERLLDVG